ncbi:MAG: NAD(P)H-dependent oxidoreductase [Termitinemataceae bacterium]
MKTMIVYAHPKTKGFNQAIAQAAAQGATMAVPPAAEYDAAIASPVTATVVAHAKIAASPESHVEVENEVVMIDLYRDHFNPVLPEDELPRKFSFDETTLGYQQLIKAADQVIFVHPDWWGGPPAILKGFLDRVFRPGVAYGFREADFRTADSPGLFGGKKFHIFITTDAQEPASGNVLDWAPARVWHDHILAFCGAHDVHIHVFWNLRNSTYAERKAWLDSIPSRVIYNFRESDTIYTGRNRQAPPKAG